jgi:hypothetical protein
MREFDVVDQFFHLINADFAATPPDVIIFNDGGILQHIVNRWQWRGRVGAISRPEQGYGLQPGTYLDLRTSHIPRQRREAMDNLIKRWRARGSVPYTYTPAIVIPNERTHP